MPPVMSANPNNITIMACGPNWLVSRKATLKIPPLLVIPPIRPTSSSCSSKYGNSLRGMRSKLSRLKSESNIASLAMIVDMTSVVYPLLHHTPHLPRLRRGGMLPPISGCVHLSVACGCGGTTLGLKQARQVLISGDKVL